MSDLLNFENHCWQDVIDEETLKIYQSYARQTYIGPKPALLGIDLYNLVYEGGPKPVLDIIDEFPSSCGINGWNAIEPTIELLSIARKVGLPVVYSTRKLSSNKRSTFRNKNNENDQSYQIKDEFKPREEDLIIYKERASCFFGTELADYLKSKDIDTIIIFGESTSGCVRATTVDAYSHGFHPVVIEECCFDRSLLNHKISLFDLHHKYADVMHFVEAKQILLNRN